MWKVGDRVKIYRGKKLKPRNATVTSILQNGFTWKDGAVVGFHDKSLWKNVTMVEAAPAEQWDLPSMTASELRAVADKLNPHVAQSETDIVRQIADEAVAIVNGSRQSAYGAPEDNFARIAKRWSQHGGVTVCPDDVALMMVDLKLARLQATPDHRDSIVDAIGYLLCYARLTLRQGVDTTVTTDT